MKNINNHPSTHEKLLFRRQFVLGPDYIEALSSWKRVDLHNGLFLTVHPDLNVLRSAKGNKSVTLLGYILNPYDIQASDQDIIDDLVNKLDLSSSLDSFIEQTEVLGGRWILIADTEDEIRLYHDPSGYRQVFHTDVNLCKELWCASQPGIISETLKLKPDKDALEFINSKFKKNSQYWWPYDTSPFKEIKRLPPNHYLNLKTGKRYRYWPNKPLSEMPLNEVVTKNSYILKEMMKSASNRFELALSMTAGKDTRLILAASKEMSERLFYYTTMHWGMNKKSWDVSIPSKIMSELGLQHSIIRCPDKMEDDFKEIYIQNVKTAREAYGTIAQGFYNDFPQEKVAVKGNAIPIGRVYYRHKLRQSGKADNEKITAHEIASLLKMGEEFSMADSRFAINAYERWLGDLGEIYNVDIMNLLYWEDIEGSWQAMNQLEWDIVQEVFVPFNCRYFLVNMLSLNEKYRTEPDFQFHKVMIMQLWPDILKEPINPTVNSDGKHIEKYLAIKKFFAKTHLNQFIPQKIKRLGRHLFPMWFCYNGMLELMM